MIKVIMLLMTCQLKDIANNVTQKPYKEMNKRLYTAPATEIVAVRIQSQLLAGSTVGIENNKVDGNDAYGKGASWDDEDM